MEFSFAETAIYGRSSLQRAYVKQDVMICEMTHAEQPKDMMSWSNNQSKLTAKTKEGRRLFEVTALPLSPK